MRKSIMICALLACLSTFGQYQRNVTLKENVFLNSSDRVFDFKNGFTGQIDTLYPPSVALPCGQSIDSLVVFTISSSEWIFGCNGYGDTEGAQVYDIDTATYNLTGAICYIQKMGMSGNLYAKIYDVNPATGAPQTLLATSDPFPNSNLPINPSVLQEAHITFADPVAITGKFALSIEWICDFPNQSATGLASTRNGCTLNSNKMSWILGSDGNWVSSQIYTNPNTQDPLLTDLYVLAVVEKSELGINNLTQRELNIFPNPANQYIMITCDSPIYEYAYIYDLAGALIHKEKMNGTSTKLNVSHIAQGTYFVSLKGKNGVVSKQITIVKK